MPLKGSGIFNDGTVLTDLLWCSTPEFGFGMAFPRLGEGCSVNQKSRLRAPKPTRPSDRHNLNILLSRFGIP